MTFLRLAGVSFAHPGRPVLEGVELALAAGDIHCLVGRSGCGKTTLLKLAAGLLAPTRGQVLWGGPATAAHERTGFVFQAPTLLDWLSARDNVLLPVSLKRRPTAQDMARADALLARLGLADRAMHRPGQLSGGQQSRVALARALLPQPPLLLLDEPFAALDAITREELQRDLLGLAREHGTTVLFVTHDIAEAVFLGDRVSVMAGGRLSHSFTVPPAARTRDTPAFGAGCAQVREALGLEVSA
ncbi:ABC transporter ATP-binding protein [Ramlibacter tataouinensis]|uniref:Candidate ABC type nitrate/sulfonate/bicarbonate transport system, permease component n=1 Tax=Ramlibacter tataouinensis (strain ATCC BAA-407 / DSM 14655 / LMG 21543 / TTB310) TaxID=365046 RepID=F5Y0G6_RAMTT|nr:ABC transporter ATP-binding protein [Ramlibacter tataouinensis]AEG93372.1 candidate ABC type nitrate/sulfonate/bicarbonate transport system, permease component [Ramlibacter tataouinensis TTB310]